MAASDSSDSTAAEVPLGGGRANTGRIVRIGDEVARPTYPQTASVDAFLRHLRSRGIDYAPEPLGSDDLGRQRVSYIVGTAPLPPYPTWAYDPELLTQVASLQRRMHVAAADFAPPPDAVWATTAGDYFPPSAAGSLVCHNDLGMSNTIVDVDSRTVCGFIDFDYCKPVSRLFDIAVAARHWVPFGGLDVSDDIDIDRRQRFGRFCDVHELSPTERREVIQLADAFLAHAQANIRALAARGVGAFQDLLDNGYEETNRSTRRWLRDNIDRLAAITH